jgi:hypothetical protein
MLDEDSRYSLGHKSDRSEISTRRRTYLRRRSYNGSSATRRVTFCGDEMNSYGLFDDTHRRKQNRYKSMLSSSSSSVSSIIYAKKYQSPGTLFESILVFLSAMFAILLVIRVIMSLLTAVVGMVILVLFTGMVVNEFLTRPVRLIRHLHTSPVLSFTSLGAILGTIHAYCMGHMSALSFTMNSSTCWIPPDFGNCLKDWFQVGAAATSYTCKAIKIDLVMLGGLIRGLAYGLQIGYLWLIIFGKSSKSTALSRYIHRRIWRPLKRQYRRSVVLIGQTKYPMVPSDRRTRNADANGDDCHHCSICLENFDNVVNSETNRERDFPLPDRYQMLPCHHCFHRDCARHWLTIQQTCPVCRVQVKGMRGCADSEPTCPGGN